MSEEILNNELNEQEELVELDEMDEDVIPEEELDEVTGGKISKPGTRTFRPTGVAQVFNTFKIANRSVIGSISPNNYLRYCSRGVVKNTGEIWISFGGISKSKTGMVTPLAGGIVGWVDGKKCVEV